jgi:hypothetical protein
MQHGRKDSLVIGHHGECQRLRPYNDIRRRRHPLDAEVAWDSSLVAEKSIHNGRPRVLERDVSLEDTSDISFEVLRSTVSCRELCDCRSRIAANQ